MIEIDLDKLNSVTKYPSIPTMHELGEKGRLTEKYNVELPSNVVITEKIDGTNCRIVIPSISRIKVRAEVMSRTALWLIGSRNEFLAEAEDLVFNQMLGIVENLHAAADKIINEVSSINSTMIVYGELFGGKIGSASKQYSSKKEFGFRIFDVKEISNPVLEALSVMTLEEISRNRESDPRRGMLSEQDLRKFVVDRVGLELVPRWDGSFLAGCLSDVQGWLNACAKKTTVELDDDAGRKSEGVVIRSADGKMICKARHADYARTLK